MDDSVSFSSAPQTGQTAPAQQPPIAGQQVPGTQTGPQISQPAPSAPVPQQPLQGSFTIPPASPPAPQPVPLVNQTPQVVPQAEDARPDAPKITLQDLYGPSAEDDAPTVLPAPEPITQAPQPTQQPVFSPHVPPQVEEAASPQVSQGDEEGGGFRVPPLIMKVLGGLAALVVVVILISFVISLFQRSTGTGKVTLTYWGLWEDSAVFQGVISDFQRQNPSISVTYVKQDPVKYTDRLVTRIQNGSGPDIFRFHNSWVTPLQQIVLPLPSDVLDKNQLQQQYFPVVAHDLVRNGALYGIPLEMDTLVLYTNKDIFDHAGAKVPTTWEDFVTVSKGLTVKDGTGHIKTAGAALGTFENVTHAPDILSLLFLQNGANLLKLQGSQNATDALTFYTSFAKTDDKVWDSTLDMSLLAFSRGKVAMYFGYAYDYFAIKAASPQFHFETHPVPHLSGRDMSVASYWAEGVSSKSKHPKEAFLFLKYLSQKDVMAKLYTEEAKTRQFGELYPRKDLATGLSSDPLLAPFVTQANTAVSSFFASDTGYDSFNGSLNRYLGNAVNSLLKDTSADTALTTLAQGVSQIFNQYATSSQ